MSDLIFLKDKIMTTFETVLPKWKCCQAHRERLIRTPGQILSLTSHLSFSAAEATADSSLGGSYTTARDSMAASHTR